MGQIEHCAMEPMYFFKFLLFLRFDAEAYFICEDEKAIVNDGRGLNTIGIFCRPDDNVPDFPTDYEWPQCVRESECIDLPTPSEESRLQKSPKIGDSVKIGENIRYICIDKDKYHETPQVRFSRNPAIFEQWIPETIILLKNYNLLTVQK